MSRSFQKFIVATAGYLGGVWSILKQPTEMPWWTSSDEATRWQAYLALTSAYLIGCAVLIITPLVFPNRKPNRAVESNTAQHINARA